MAVTRFRNALRFSILVLAAAAIATPPAGAYVRVDVPNAHYLVGYLASKAGSMTIQWDPMVESDDNVDPDPSATAADARRYQYSLGTTLRSNARDDSFLPDPDDFASVPTPRKVFVNVTRLIVVDLYLKGGQSSDFASCGSIELDVELWQKERLVAGGIGRYSDDPQYESFGEPRWDATPKVPTGYCLYSHRLQAETPVIEKGAQLTLKILHRAQGSPFQYGLAGDHRSQIRIPFFSADDVVYRLATPKLGSASVEALDGSALRGVLGLLHGGGAALLAPLALPRMRRSPSALGLMLAALAFSGCAGASSGDDAAASPALGGQASQVFVDGDPSQANGSILGTVFDELHEAVRGAHVSLLTMGFFTTTGDGGRFGFPNVPPRTYTLRVEHAGYKVLETAVAVRAGDVTRLDVELAPLVVRPESESRHRHDYWDGRSEVELLKDVEVGSIQCATGLTIGITEPSFSTRCTEANFFIPAQQEGKSLPTVLPGTVAVTVRVDWTSGSGYNADVQRLGLMFQTSQDPSADNWTLLYPRGNGKAFEIPASWEMTDAGHQAFSNWNFRLFVPPGDIAFADSVRSLQTPYGPFLVSVAIHRGGNLPLDAPHPNLWGTASSLVVLQEERRLSGANMSWTPSKVVPQGTTWLDVVLRQDHEVATHSFDWDLSYKGGQERVADCPTGDPKYTGATDAERNGLVWRWTVPIKASEADPTYAVRTNWCLWTSYPGDQTGTTTYQTLYGSTFSPLYNPVGLNLTVVAHRDGLKGA